MDLFANVTGANETRMSSPHSPNWTLLLGVKAFVMIASICLNVVVSIYHVISVEVTSFGVYLLALFIGNILYCAIVTPIEITSQLFGKWWMGHAVCVFYNYFEFAVAMAPVMFHALIAISRIWAVAYPVSYKERHNKKIAVFLCLAGVCYAHIVIMPGYIMDTLYYHLPEEHYGCVLNTPVMKSWGRAENLLDRLTPLSLIMCTYVSITLILWRRKRRRLGHASMNSYEMYIVRTVKRVVEPNSTYTGTGVRPKRKIRASFVLTLTAISITVCWLPASAMYFGFLFFDIRFSETAFTVVMLMYSFQSIFDPLMLIFSLKRLGGRIVQ